MLSLTTKDGLYAMEVRDIALVFSMVAATVGLFSSLGALVFFFGVIRTTVNVHSEDFKSVWAHMNNQDIHFNQKAFNEFEKRITQSVQDLKEDVKEVKEYCEEIDGKLDRELRAK